MKNRPMTYHAVLADPGVMIRVTMHDAVVLDVRPRPDTDRIGIASDNRMWPYTDMIAQFHVPDDRTQRVDIDRIAQFRIEALKYPNGARHVTSTPVLSLLVQYLQVVSPCFSKYR